MLTAFLIASLVLLQPDNSQTTVQLLSLIALQNPATPPHMQAFLNDTAESLPSTVEYHASTSVLTINTLWFTSLVLSLAAALFGILAKQWCREYLRWHSVNAAPRENVLLRQVRAEAWERWRMASYIATVPALLEIALFLFLVGVFIFVPMFSERSFTAIVSLVNGGTLAAVTGLTVLPVFYRLCPFQSPTGWAIVRLAAPLRRAFWSLARSLPVVTRWWCRLTKRRREPTWSMTLRKYVKRRTTYLGHLVDWRDYNLLAVQDPTICEPTGFNLQQACLDDYVDYNGACVDMVQTHTLIRALSWVRRGSLNDITAHTAVLDCMPFIHAENPSIRTAENPQFLSSMAAICPANLVALRVMVRSIFLNGWRYPLAFCAGPESPFRPGDILGPFLDTRAHRELQEQYPMLAGGAWESDPVTYELCHGLLRSDLLALADQWVALAGEPETAVRVADRIAHLLCLLRIVSTQAVYDTVSDAGRTLTRPFAKTLNKMFQKLGPHDAAYAGGIMSMCVELAHLLGPVEFKREEREQRITSTYDSIHSACDDMLTDGC